MLCNPAARIQGAGPNTGDGDPIDVNVLSIPAPEGCTAVEGCPDGEPVIITPAPGAVFTVTQEGCVQVEDCPTGTPVRVTVQNFPAVQPVSDNGGSLTVDGTVTANQGTSPWVVSLTAPADNSRHYSNSISALNDLPAGNALLSFLNPGPSDIRIYRIRGRTYSDAAGNGLALAVMRPSVNATAGAIIPVANIPKKDTAYANSQALVRNNASGFTKGAEGFLIHLGGRSEGTASTTGYYEGYEARDSDDEIVLHTNESIIIFSDAAFMFADDTDNRWIVEMAWKEL